MGLKFVYREYPPDGEYLVWMVWSGLLFHVI